MIIPSVSHDLRGGVSAPIMARPNCSNGDDVGGGNGGDGVDGNDGDGSDGDDGDGGGGNGGDGGGGNDGDGVQVEVEEEVGFDDDDGDEETDDTLVHLLTLSGYQCS